MTLVELVRHDGLNTIVNIEDISYVELVEDTTHGLTLYIIFKNVSKKYYMFIATREEVTNAYNKICYHISK
jgi:hypothetical protein